MQPQASSGPVARLPHRRRGARSFLLASLVMIVGIAGLPGCGNAEAPQEPAWMGETAEQDSAGVRIVVAPGASLSTVLPWRISELPDLVLGHRDDDASYQFHRIAGGRGCGRRGRGEPGTPLVRRHRRACPHGRRLGRRSPRVHGASPPDPVPAGLPADLRWQPDDLHLGDPRWVRGAEIRRDWILGRWVGDDGVEQVRRHALDRHGG